MRLEVTTTLIKSMRLLRHRSTNVRATLLLVAVVLALLAAPVLPGPWSGPVSSASAAPPFTLYMPVPWGVTVTVNGPHGWLGSSGTRSGVDFFPKGGLTVTSAASGVAHVESNCVVRVDHADGWQTKYLHLKNIDRSINGQQIDAGRRLGDAGSPAETCGTGWGAHVHFALFRNGVEQSIDGTSIGGYTVHNGSDYYCGWWSRDADGANLGYNNCDSGEATLALPNNQRQPPSGPPPDTDGDGVPDASDRCPNEAGPADNGGCPLIEGRVPWIGAVDNSGSLRLLHWTGSTWQNDNFSQAVAAGSHPSVYLSADNRPLISWVDDTGSLRLSHWTGTAWQHDNFKLGVRAGTSPSAFNGSGGNPFISWVDDTGSLRLSHWTGRAWQHDNFKLGVRAGTSPSAFNGSGGNPFISWVDDTGSLRLSHWTGTAWQHDNFKLGVRAGTSPSAFNGSGGNPFISWVDDTGSLRLSHWASTAWQHDNFSQGVRAGTSPSAYLGRGGTLWIGWVDNAGSLRLSHWTGTAWQNDNFSQGVLAETSPTASLGPNGEPFISWVDPSATLWLSHWTGSAWQNDNLGLVVYTPSMANDSAPAVDGTAKVGSTLSASTGGWTPTGGSYRYQWLADGRPIDGATGPTYTLGAGDAGKVVSVRVTASKAGYRATSAASSGLLVTLSVTNPGGDGTGVGNPAGVRPTAIAAAKVRFPAKKTALISWTSAPNATSYRIRVSKKDSTKRWNAWTTVTKTSVKLNGLKKKSVYRVQILPVGPGGTGPTTTWKFKQRK